MRPRLARRGEPRITSRKTTPALSFNAAPARSPGRTDELHAQPTPNLWLQCGPGSLAGENFFSLCRRALAGSKLQCGPGSLAGENAMPTSCPIRPLRASMRPRLARRGEPLRPATARSRPLCFNAAPARSPGRTALLLALSLPAQALQCGPGSLAGENFVRFGWLCGRWRASMRPRLARRGERDRLRHGYAGEESFNAAPARSPGRTSRRRTLQRRGLELQCGPGSLAGENSSTRFVSIPDRRLQCGPGSLAGENPRILAGPDGRDAGFNAAPARSPGRTRTLPRSSAHER